VLKAFAPSLCALPVRTPNWLPVPAVVQRAKQVASIRRADEGACVYARPRHTGSAAIGPTACSSLGHDRS
jgi:hypothetical protein